MRHSSFKKGLLCVCRVTSGLELLTAYLEDTELITSTIENLTEKKMERGMEAEMKE